MKKRFRPRMARGVTVIEVLMGAVALALLLALAFPSITTFLQNARLRAQAEAVTNALNMARSEARRRAQPVEFVLAFGALGAPSHAKWSAIGESWVVRTANGSRAEVIDARSAVRHGGLADSADVRVEASHHRAAGGALGSSIVFAADGSLAQTMPVQLDITPVSGMCVGLRCVRIIVALDGSLRQCDPIVDPREPARRCPVPAG